MYFSFEIHIFKSIKIIISLIIDSKIYLKILIYSIWKYLLPQIFENIYLFYLNLKKNTTQFFKMICYPFYATDYDNLKNSFFRWFQI